MSSRLIDRVKSVVQHVGGGGAKAPSTHEDPLIAPGVGRGVMIAPMHPDPAWPTPNYINRLGRRIRTLRDTHPEIYDEWRSFMEDHIETVPLKSKHGDPLQQERERLRWIGGSLAPFVRKHRGVLGSDPDDPPES